MVAVHVRRVNTWRNDEFSKNVDSIFIYTIVQTAFIMLFKFLDNDDSAVINTLMFRRKAKSLECVYRLHSTLRVRAMVRDENILSIASQVNTCFLGPGAVGKLPSRRGETGLSIKLAGEYNSETNVIKLAGKDMVANSPSHMVIKDSNIEYGEFTIHDDNMYAA